MPISDAELSDLYMRYAPILHARARSILGSAAEADDAVQETFARVLRAGDGFRGESSPLTWMYQVNTNWCLNRLRDRKGHDRKHHDHRDEIVGSDASDGDVPEGLDDERVRELLGDADDETRQIVIHLFFDDMTREEAAKQVGISVPTLRKRLAQFLRRSRFSLGLGVLAGSALWLWSVAGGSP